ncbi:MAG: hypothetical protein GXP63_04290 [DPANN group archaeon]|nr:hypothetical protein [DPANN group archaeon]
MKKGKSDKKQDRFYAKFAFWLSLGFWIPLFNIALSIGSLTLAVMAIRRHYHDPERFGGMGFAITALVLSSAGIIMTIIGLIIYLNSAAICASAICTSLQ